MQNRVAAFSRLDASPEYGPITLSKVVAVGALRHSVNFPLSIEPCSWVGRA